MKVLPTTMTCLNHPGPTALVVGKLCVLVAVAAAVTSGFAAHAQTTAKPAADAPSTNVKPALTVTTVIAQSGALPLALSANGSIAAWQEASVGAEANGWRLAEVRVNVGDLVKKGQVLATFAADMVRADLAQSRASLLEAEATLAEAAANAQRARELQTSGALSAQQINQYLTAERTAAARLEAMRAATQVQQLRLVQTQVLAPDNGVISARLATVGAVVPAGQELFRLIRGGRLEWRAEVSAIDLASIKPGMAVRVAPAGTTPIKGQVRIVAPTVDATTRNGLVYIDLPEPGAAKAGMFARGDFELGQSSAMTLPQGAVLLRDGFAWVFKVGADARVSQSKVTVGRRVGGLVEVLSGLETGARVVASGGGFLSDGDLVRIVESKPNSAAASTSSTSSTPPAAAGPATAGVAVKR